MDRTLVASATNLLARGFLVIPTDRVSTAGEPVNGLFAVARAISRALAFKLPARAVAVVGPPNPAWPPLLAAQLAALPELLRALGFHVVHADDEVHTVASYARAALEVGDAIVVGVDKRYAQLVGDRLWWYDANKDVRYTPEIVQKRFTVPPAQVGEWLGLVGDDDALPGVKGVGAKGATTLLEAHGSVAAALAAADTLPSRLARPLRAAADNGSLAAELTRARLDTAGPLPLALDDAAYAPTDAATLNALLSRLGFAELLASDGTTMETEVVTTADRLAALLATAEPIAIHALFEDPDPVRTALDGVALSLGAGEAWYVPRASAAWPRLAAWLADPHAAKLGHDLLPLIVEQRRAGAPLAGITGDTACASHLTQPSNWAPHDLAIVARHALGRALPDEETTRGVGKQRKPWAALPAGHAARFAGQRADTAAALWRALGPTVDRAMLAEYLELTDIAAGMELDGILIDLAALDRAQEALAAIEADLTTQIEALAGRSFNINSSQQLGAVLFEELKLPIVSHTKTGWSTSLEALERIEHAHPIVPLVLRWRLLRRLRDFWIIALRRTIDADGRVHSRAHPARSFSGHLINTNPDLSRVPGRTPEMQMIRRAFVAPPGRLLMSVDFNQLGLHVLAHLTKDPNLVEPLRRRDDMHRLTAGALLDKPIDALTDDDRQLGKVVNFATFAGQGPSALALQLGVSAAEAKDLIAKFDQHYALVRAFQDEQHRLARERGYITTISGRHWPIGGLESLDSHDRSYAERLARRATHEGSVADVSRRALLHAARALRAAKLTAWPLCQVLDEVLFEVAESELLDAARVASHAMRHAYELEVPLVVGAWAGPTWADLEQVSL